MKEEQAAAVVRSLRKAATKATRDGMKRYGIPSDKAFGVTMSDMQKIAKRMGHDHELALALWETGWYEARIVAAFVDEPARVTPTQMDLWAREFENWAICDTVCFHLFDRTPHAFRKVAQWSGRQDEFVRRGAFALLACVALHDKAAEDEPFLRSLPLVEEAAKDERNFVKKGVSWALRSVGRRNLALHAAALAVAQRLAASADPTERWVGKDALKDITRPAIVRALETRAAPAGE